MRRASNLPTTDRINGHPRVLELLRQPLTEALQRVCETSKFMPAVLFVLQAIDVTGQAGSGTEPKVTQGRRSGTPIDSPKL